MLACFVGLSSLGANQDCNDSFCESMVAPPLFAALQRHAAALTMHLGRSGLARYRAVSVAIDTPTGPEPPRHRFRPTVQLYRGSGRARREYLILPFLTSAWCCVAPTAPRCKCTTYTACPSRSGRVSFAHCMSPTSHGHVATFLTQSVRPETATISIWPNQ